MTIGMPDSVRIARATSMPLMPGSIRSSSTMSGPALPESGQGALAVGDEGGQEALAAQDDAEHLGQRWVVIDDQYPGSHAVQYCTVLPNPAYPGADLVRPAAYANSARPQKSPGPETPGGQANRPLETCRMYSFIASCRASLRCTGTNCRPRVTLVTR